MGMDVGADFELSLKRLAGGLTARRPVYRFEKFVRCSQRSFERTSVSKEILFLDPERKIIGIRVASIGTNNDMLAILAQADLQGFEDCWIKLHGPASSSPAKRLATAANAPWDSKLFQGTRAFVRHKACETILAISPRTDLERLAPAREKNREG